MIGPPTGARTRPTSILEPDPSVRQDATIHVVKGGHVLAASAGLIVALGILVVVLVVAFFFVWKRAPRT